MLRDYASGAALVELGDESIAVGGRVGAPSQAMAIRLAVLGSPGGAFASCHCSTDEMRHTSDTQIHRDWLRGGGCGRGAKLGKGLISATQDNAGVRHAAGSD